jgi:hypothetical protein
MTRLIFKYLSYFALVLGVAASIYKIGGFFANMQNDIDQSKNTLVDIKLEQTEQSKEIKDIKFEMMEITDVQEKQRSFNSAIDRSWSDHLKKSKELIDEYTKYLEMKVQDEKKKRSLPILWG